MGAKAHKPLTGKRLDREIERLYYQHAQGRQINVMKIGSLFAGVRGAVEKGADLETAVKVAIDLFCEPKAEGGLITG